VAAGYVTPITVTVPGKDIGSTITVRMVAYDGSSFDNSSGWAFSNQVTVTLGGGTVLPPDLVGLQGMCCIPEPSALAFVPIGTAALMLRRRK
jgi:hypothetical protein